MRPADWAFWSHPLWLEYCTAYGCKPSVTQGLHGNLVAGLAGGPETIWRNIGKGHRADIGRARGEFFVVRHVEELYEAIHKEAYCFPRTQRTYDVQRRMCRAGIAYANAIPDHAAALFFVLGEGSYYASAARIKESRGVAHLLVWDGMLEAQRRGALWMDFGPAPGPNASAKYFSIAAFKKHFGATVQ